MSTITTEDEEYEYNEPEPDWELSSYDCPFCGENIEYQHRWYEDNTEYEGNEETFFHKDEATENQCFILRKMGGYESIEAYDLMEMAEQTHNEK